MHGAQANSAQPRPRSGANAALTRPPLRAPTPCRCCTPIGRGQPAGLGASSLHLENRRGSERLSTRGRAVRASGEAGRKPGETGLAVRRWQPSQPASNLGQRGIFRSGVYRATAMRQDRSATHFIACPHSGNGPRGVRADPGSASTLGPGPRCPRRAVNRLPRARRKPSKAGSWHSEEERGAWKRATVCILSTFV